MTSAVAQRWDARLLKQFRHQDATKVKELLLRIQNEQEARREMMALTRIENFLTGLEDAETVLRNAGVTVIAFDIDCWGPMHHILSTISSVRDNFDNILDAYQQIGTVFPSLRKYSQWISENNGSDGWLRNIFYEVTDFHLAIVRCLRQPKNRQMFRAQWADSRFMVNSCVDSLRRQNEMLDRKLQAFAVSPIVGHTYGSVVLENGGTLHQGNVYGADSAQIESLLEGMADVKKDVDKIKQEFERSEFERQQARRESLNYWLAAADFERYHYESFQVHEKYPETGNWILEHDKVRRWLREQSPKANSLWVHGGPGVGKTILASVLIDESKHPKQLDQPSLFIDLDGIQKDSNPEILKDLAELKAVETCYFYCKYDDEKTTNATSILQGFLAQSLRHQPGVAALFDDEKSKSGRPVLGRDSARITQKLLNLVCSNDKPMHFIIDGLDECHKSERAEILDFLNRIMLENNKDSTGNIRLLVISQRETDIADHLQTYEELSLDADHIRNDIEIYVTQQIDASISGPGHPQLGFRDESLKAKFHLSNDLAASLQRQICAEADGQFLYAKLMIENMRQLPNRDAFDRELIEKPFPKRLEEAYERILRRIYDSSDGPTWKTTRRLLGWLVAMKRPVRTFEMQGAISINPELQTVNFDKLSLCKDPADFCGALVSVQGEHISLVHRTARHFLQHSELIDAQYLSCDLLATSLYYLSFECFLPELEQELIDEYMQAGYYAFSDYAIAKWHYHFDDFVSLVNRLDVSSATKGNARTVQRLLEAFLDFCDMYEESLNQTTQDLLSDYRKDSNSPDVQSYKGSVKRLEAFCHRFSMISSSEVDMEEEDETSDESDCYAEHIAAFAKIYQHLVDHKRKGSIRTDVTLNQLGKAQIRIRERLELQAPSESKQYCDIATYHGQRVFKCKRVNCFSTSTKDSNTKRRETSTIVGMIDPMSVM